MKVTRKNFYYEYDIRDISIPAPAENKKSAFAGESITTVVNIPNVRGNRSISFGPVEYISFIDSEDRKPFWEISIIAKEYRREVDIEARKKSLSFAAGHDDYQVSPYPYNHELAHPEHDELG